MVAILADAVDCYHKHFQARTSKRRRLFMEAERWILSDDCNWVFSFRNICDVLGVDAGALRTQTLRWKRHQLEAAMPHREMGAAS